MIRFSVQADSKAECLHGLQLLCTALDVQIIRDPADTFNSWLARTRLNPPADDSEPGHE